MLTNLYDPSARRSSSSSLRPLNEDNYVEVKKKNFIDHMNNDAYYFMKRTRREKRHKSERFKLHKELSSRRENTYHKFHQQRNTHDYLQRSPPVVPNQGRTVYPYTHLSSKQRPIIEIRMDIPEKRMKDFLMVKMSKRRNFW